MRSEISSRTVAGIALSTIIAASIAVSILWVNVIPVFESPDEPAHFDYAFSIANAGHLLRARDGHSARAPATDQLAFDVDLNRIAFQPTERIYQGYGSAADRLRLNAIPSDNQSAYVGPDPMRALMNHGYPPGYYALAALAMRLGGLPNAGIFRVFLAARMLSVILFGVGLYFWYRAIRAANIPRLVALFTIAAVGLAPLSSFISSYVQPDNLTFTLVGASLWTALRARRAQVSVESVAWFGLALGGLWATKYHYALIVAAATVPMLLLSLARRRKSAYIVTIVVMLLPSVAAFGISQWTLTPRPEDHENVVHAFAAPVEDAFKSGAGMHFVRIMATNAFNDLLLTNAHSSYWGVFGWLDTAITTGNGRINEIVTGVLRDGTIIALILWAIAVFRNAGRLVGIGISRGWSTALTIALSDPIPLSYAGFFGLLFFLWVISADLYGAQGRYFYPFEPAVVLAVIWYAPKAVRQIRWRRFVGCIGGVIVGGYSLVFAPVAVADVVDRYYAPELPANARGIALTHVAQLDVANGGAVDYYATGAGGSWTPYTGQPLAPRSQIVVRGWASDPRIPVRPVRGVEIEIDGRFAGWGQAGLERDDVAAVLGVPALVSSGYNVDVSIGDLKPGPHTVALDFLDADGDALLRPLPLHSLEVKR